MVTSLRSKWAVGKARLEKQPTDLRRHHHYMRDGALVAQIFFEKHSPHLYTAYEA
jgi:hypothetical protein